MADARDKLETQKLALDLTPSQAVLLDRVEWDATVRERFYDSGLAELQGLGLVWYYPSQEIAGENWILSPFGRDVLRCRRDFLLGIRDVACMGESAALESHVLFDLVGLGFLDTHPLRLSAKAWEYLRGIFKATHWSGSLDSAWKVSGWARGLAVWSVNGDGDVKLKIQIAKNRWDEVSAGAIIMADDKFGFLCIGGHVDDSSYWPEGGEDRG